MSSRPPTRRAGKRVTRRSLVSVGLVGVVFTAALTLVPVASNSTMKGKPVVAKPVATPAQPVAGKPFAVSFQVTRSDTATPLAQGRMTARAAIAGREVRHTQSYKGGTARVALLVPANAAGKTLTVTVTIKDGTTSATRVSAYRVLGPPSVSIGDASVTEGNSGTTTMSLSGDALGSARAARFGHLRDS
jgi:hypothetical protein